MYVLILNKINHKVKVLEKKLVKMKLCIEITIESNTYSHIKFDELL